MEELLRLGEKLGFEGVELRQFVLEQQENQRLERQLEREEKKRVEELEREEKRRVEELEEKKRVEEREERRRVEELEREERRRVEELEEKRRLDELEERRQIREYEERNLLRLADSSKEQRYVASEDGSASLNKFKVASKVPKMPMFIDGRDDLDSYLSRFERLAIVNDWDRDDWAGALSVLLTGKALEAYSSMSISDSCCYDKLKLVLLNRYELTEDGYRRKFREARPDKNETPSQFLTRLRNYFQRWYELSGAVQTVTGLTDLIIAEQFFDICKTDLTVHLKLNKGSPEQLAETAEKFLSAHGRDFASLTRNSTTRSIIDKKVSCLDNSDRKADMKTDTISVTGTRCFRCKEIGHKANECHRKMQIRCYVCNGSHHERNCKLRNKTETKAASALLEEEKSGITGHSDGQSTAHGDELALADGSTIKLIKSGGSSATGGGSNLPIAEGTVGTTRCQVMRDSGCSGIIVKSKFVRDDQFTGKFGYMLRVDNTVVQARKARIEIDTPFLSGSVESLCLDDCLCDLIIGNVEGAKPPSVIETPINAAAVETRAGKKKALPTALQAPSISDHLSVDRERLIDLQSKDESIARFQQEQGTQEKGQAKIGFSVKNGILYRTYKHPKVDFGRMRWQVVVPTPLRQQVMKIAHESIVAGHMGTQRTINRITTAFYWPGIYGDTKDFCLSCDVCQKTVKRGTIPKAPLMKMPLIETPFKRVGVDLVGPISPPSESGHRYILTLVDYATRYPEAVALKNIDTETVAESLVSIYCRVGVPEEILTDMGTQFVSQCMSEVARLLSIKQLSTSPYNPQCNGLTERFNGTLKTMLKRLCQDQPKQWHRYIDPLLFAYREVPQETTGFSPFELLYGRQVRGPMQILRDLWTEEDGEPEVRTSYQYVLELQNRLETTLELAREQVSKAQEQQNTRNKNAKMRVLKEGDEVLLLLPTSQNKLLLQWKGPYKITERVSQCNYKLSIGGKARTYHINLLKKYVRRPSAESTAPVETCAAVAVISDGEIHHEVSDDDNELIALFPLTTEDNIADLRICDRLSNAQKREVNTVITDCADVFSNKPGLCKIAKHRIKLTDETPVTSKPYSVPFSLKESLQKDFEEMLRQGIIRHSSSSYASPVVVVRKKDGSNRICVDYRKLNKLTEFDPQPLMSVKDTVKDLGKCQYFSKLDMTSGYWQIPVSEEDIHKTAFVTQEAKYEFTRTPFGMVNSGATLNRCLKNVLEGVSGVSNYLDDILVHTVEWSDHLRVLRIVLNRLRESGLTVKPSKCEIAYQEVDFLGHRIGKDRIQPQEDNSAKIRDSKRPETKKEVRSFLGLTGFYREFVPDYATKAAPLTDLLKKGKPNKVVWTTEHESAFQSLQAAITSEPILRLPDPKKRFILRTDASNFGLGASLLQEFDDGLFPVGYASRKLLERERKYSVMERECLAIVFGIKKFAVYLVANEFTLQTDNQPLAYLNKTKYESDRVMRWAMFLQNYKFHLMAIKGRDNVIADYLSRSEQST